MPLESTDPGYKTWLLQKQGYDPSQYNMDDDGNVSTKVIAQPNLPTNREPVPDDGPIAQTKPQTTSSTQAFLGHAGSSLLPTLGGLGTAAGAAALGPETGGLSIALPIIAGLLGGGATSKIQSSLQSDDTKQNLATEQEEHPIASKLGDIAPSALAFNPIKGAMEAPGIIRNIPKLLGSNPNALTSAEIDGLKAAGLNVGIQSGINTAQQLSSDQPFNYEDLAADAASGLVLNSPWGVGKMLFPEHGNTAQVRPNAKPDANITSPVEPPPPIPVSAYGGVPPEQSDVTAQPTPGGNQRGNAMYYYKEGVDTEPQQIAMEGEGGPSVSSDTGDADNLSGIPPENVRQTDFLRAQAEQEQQTRDSLALQRAKDIQSSLGASQAIEEDSPLIQGTNPQRDNTRGMQAANEDVASGSDLDERQAEGTDDKYQPETAPLDDSEKQQFGLFSQSDPRYIKAVSQLAVKRGISLQRANEILTANGNQARGSMNQGTRVARINPAIATEDTPTHEVLGHGYVDDLLASSIPSDRALAQRAMNIFGGAEGADEFVADKLGKKTVGDLKTQTYGTKADQSKLWFRDFLSRWKNTLGVASDEDVMNHLSRRAITDAPRGTRGEIGENPIALNTTVKNQEEQQSINPKQNELLQNYYRAANAVAGRTEYGRRSAEAHADGYIASWSNASKRWDVAQGLGKIKKGQNVDIDANQILIRGKSLKDIKLIADNLPPLPLDTYSFENSPLKQLGQTNKSHSKIVQELADFWKQEPKTPDVVKHTEAFMDKIRSPEQSKFQEELPEGQGKGAAARLSELTNKGEALTPEEAVEKEALQKKSDSLEGKWKFQGENELGQEHEKREDGSIKIPYVGGEGNPIMSFREASNPIEYHRQKIELAAVRNGMSQFEASEYAKKLIPDNPNLKYQPAEEPFKLGSTKEERAPTKGDEHPLPFSSMPGFRSSSDLILAKDGDRARPALAAAGKTLDEAAGKANDWIEQKNEAWKGISREDKNLMEAKGVQGVQEKRDTTQELPYHLQEPFKAVKDILRSQQQEAINAKQPVKRGGSPSERRIDPNFWPQQYDPNAITLMKGKSAEGARLRKADTDYMVSKGMTKEQALERQNALLSPDTTAKPDMSHFRGLDVEQGIGVAPELQRPGADRNLERYFNRYAMGRSFHDNIESKPDIAPLFGIKKSPLGVNYDSKIEPLRSPEATALLSHLKGEDYHPGEGVLNASAKTAAAGMLGPMTAAHIGLSSQFTMMTLAKPNELAGMVVAGTKNIGKAVKEAYSRGLLRYKPELLRDLLDAHSNAAERISSLGDLVSKVNGREDVVKYSSAMLLNQAKYLVDSRIPQAVMGDKQSIRMLQQLDPTWNSGKTYSEDEKGALAANLVRTIHGHDFRSLPPWMLSDNIIHPFVSLMSWNVSQTNSFFKHTVSAAREGNFTPLIMSTLGAGLGGYIIKEAREKLANKQSPIPTLSELAASSKGLEGNKPLIAYNLAAMASYAGYAGILSTAARDIFDVMYKNPAQGSIFPLDEVLSNSMKTVSQAASAIANSNGIDNYIDIGTRASADLLRENVQLARMITSWGDEKGIFGEYRQEKKELNTSEGDLRRFKMAEGMPVEDQGSIDESNPYFNMGRKNFQKEQDIGKAAGELPGLIEDAFKSSNGNIEVLRSKLSALKRESYPSMPSPENAPITFYKYVNFLNKTQGPEIAAKRVQDYFIHNAINKAKSSMVPSI